MTHPRNQGTMKALWYEAPRQFVIKSVPIPRISDDEVLLKVEYCGICGTDAHIHDGEFISKFPLIPGHEVVGVLSAIGKNVKDFEVGDRCVADNCSTCDECFFCRRGKYLLCENFASKGVTMDGGFAEYVTFHKSKLYKLNSLTSIQATLVEPAACAIHGLDRLKLTYGAGPGPTSGVGAEVLLLGAGPTGLILAQLLKLNGASRVIVAARKGVKMDVAKRLGVADAYVEVDRLNPEAEWKALREGNPYGFDVVIEATGVEKVAQDSIDFVRRGGTLIMYGVYENDARVSWAPSRIFADEINIIGSFAQTHCFPRAVAYLESGKVKVDGMVTDVFPLEEYQNALDKMNSRNALKIAIKLSE